MPFTFLEAVAHKLLWMLGIPGTGYGIAIGMFCPENPPFSTPLECEKLVGGGHVFQQERRQAADVVDLRNQLLARQPTDSQR